MATFNTQALIEGYEKAIKLAKDFLDLSKDTNLQIKQTAENIETFSKGLNTATAKGLKDANAEMEKANELTELKIKNDKEAQKTEQELIKTEKLLSQARILETKEKEELHKLEQIRNKTLIQVSKERQRQLAIIKKNRIAIEKEQKAIKQANREYSKQSKLLNDTRNAYKDLFLETEKNRKGFKGLFFGFTKAGKALRKLKKETGDYDKKLKDLDESVGQSFRKIGQYENALKGLNSTMAKVGAAGALAGLLGKLAERALKVRGASLATKSAIAGLTAGFKVFSSSLGQALPFLIKGVISLKAEFNSFFLTASIWIKSAKLEWMEFKNLLSFGSFTDEITKVEGKLEDLKEEQEANTETVKEGRKAWSDLFDVFGKMGDRTTETKEAIIKLYKEQDIAIDRTAKLSKEVAKYTVAEQLALALEGENAGALRDRVKAIEDAVKWNKLRTQSEVELAEVQISLVRSSIEVEKIASGLGDAYKMTAEETITLTEATNALILAQGEQATSAIDNRAKVTQLALDILEQEADFLLDGFENQKSINERKLENDNVTLTEKKKILDQMVKDQAEFQKNSQDIFNKSLIDLGFKKNEIDLIQEEVDLNKLLLILQEKGSKALLEEIQLLKSSEIGNKQIFDHVRDINTQLEDQAENLETIVEKTREIEALREDVADQERRLSGVADAESAQIKRKEQIVRLQKELNELEVEGQEEKTKKQLEVEKELNALLLDEQKDFQNKSKALAEESAQFVLDRFNEFQDAKMSALERELEHNLRNQDIILQGIENGSKLGEASLALEKKVQAEREAELKRLERKALQLKALIALLEVWGQTGDLGETLQGFATIKAAASTADGAFYEGTDSVGSTGSETYVHSGKDGFNADLNGGEIVLNNKESNEARKLGFGKRSDMLDVFRMSDMGVDNGGNLVTMVNDNALVVSELKELKEVMKTLPKNMPIHNTGLNDDPRYINQVIKRGNSRTTTKRKANTGWGL